MSLAVLDEPLHLSDADLTSIVRLVYERSGITLHDGKRALIVARLQGRVRRGGFRSFGAYLRHVEQDASGDALTGLLDAICTNHTSFFREPAHFDFLAGTALADLRARAGTRRLEGWSAACSTGEEPYTLAITLREALGPEAAREVGLMASDLSTKALDAARRGVYRTDRVTGVPPAILRGYFEKGLGAQQGLARVRRDLRERIEFRRLNLLELPPLGRAFDFIFCRNVMIYFDAHVQQRVVDALERVLVPGGYLFISHSESLNAVRHPLQWVAPAVYRKRAA